MKTTYKYIAMALLAVGLASCGDGVNLDAPGVETDLNNIPLPESDSIQVPLKENTVPMVHNGGLYTINDEGEVQSDFNRVKAKLAESGDNIWKRSFEKLKANKYAQLSFNSYPTETIERKNGGGNFMNAARAAAGAYEMALIYRISGDQRYGDQAVKILNAWAETCKSLSGDTNIALGAGLYGYEFAVAGELMRGYEGWADASFRAFQDWMVKVFYPQNSGFLKTHFGTPDGHYWSNWGLCNIASLVAIGVVADRRDIYNEGIEHFQVGKTTGCLTKAIFHVFTGEDANLAQWQESNRDQGHTYMAMGLVGVICKIAYTQGDDFFASYDNLFLKGCEYLAKYNYANLDVPNVPYTREYKGPHGTAYEEHPTISGRLRQDRPIWAIPYYHYKDVAKVPAEKYKYTEMAAKAVEGEDGEGGAGDYGDNSGGYDALFFGTLMNKR